VEKFASGSGKILPDPCPPESFGSEQIRITTRDWNGFDHCCYIFVAEELNIMTTPLSLAGWRERT
jgi:hypothetical protein